MTDTLPQDTRCFPADVITQFIQHILEACGVSQGNAGKTADLITQADLGGADAHGIFRLPQYVRRLCAGGMNPDPEITIIKQRAGTALIDGDNGIGHLVMSSATEIAIEKARKTGIAWVGARNSNHAGPASLYPRMALAHDMIGIYMAVGSANHLPPWGGTDMLLSTNPIAVAIPSNEISPIVLDMATTVAAYGKIKTALQKGEMLPEGWMIDKQGMPITDPVRAVEGFLQPIGGYKGYGLALVFGLLAGTLNGAAFGRSVIDFNADDTSVTNTGHLIMVLDISAFSDVDLFKKEIDEAGRMMKASRKLPGVSEIFLPGEQSARTMSERKRNGIPIQAELYVILNKLAEELNVKGL